MQNILDNEKETSAPLAGYRLAPQQRQVWQQQESRSAAGANGETTTGASISYDAQSVVKLTGRLQPEALRTAMITVIEQHEILRTSFQRQPGMRTLVQVISEQPALRWREEDLTEHDNALQRREIEVVSKNDKRAKTSDTDASGAVLRVSLLRLAAAEHVVVLTLPTLCADYTSLSFLTREISRAYDECIGGGIASNEFLQYVDFSEWQNELAKSEDADAGRAFWFNQQAVSMKPLRLPFEERTHPGSLAHVAIGEGVPSISTAAPERLSFTLSSKIASQLDGVAARCAVSTQTILLACWQVLLWRLTTQEGFSVSCLFDVRHYEELNDALGLFARSLPLFCRLQGQHTLLSFAQEIEERCAHMSEWQEYYEGGEAAPAEQIGFEYFERAGSWTSASGLEWEVKEQRSESQPTKLALRCEKIKSREGEARAELEVEISYDSQAYIRADVERLLGRMQRVVESAVESVDQTIIDMPVVSEREWKYLVNELSQPEEEAGAAGGEQSIVEMFDEAARRFSSRVAVVNGDEELTFGELNRRTSQLGRFLRARGVGPDVKVALFMERSVHAFVALLAVLKAGGAFVPLNLEQPKERLAHQLADMEAPFILTEEKLLPQLPRFDGAVVCLDRDAELLKREAESCLAPVGSAQHLAYVIYTSGSTGTPKGVGVTRQNLLNYTLYMCRRLRLELPANGKVTSFATVSTLAADLGHTAIFPSLVTGGCLHLIGSDVATDGDRFAAYVREHPVDVLKIVPSHLSALLTGREEVEILPRKYLILGGEALSHQLVARLAQTSSACRIINHYGPTETTVGCLTFDLGQTSACAAAATVPIGRPIANTQAYVVDAHGRPVPLGTSGELLIGGAGVARGYLNQPAHTAERFIPDSFSGKAGARLYQTGDLVRQLRGGEIEFLGRVDSQVKIRGYRIELGEIEVALRQHPAVLEVVVVASEDERQHKRLAAYIVGSRNLAPSAGELRSFLLTRLPEYMLPSVFVLLDEMPLTPNGKLDRRALPDAEAERTASAGCSAEGPRSAIEETLAGIWQQVLGIAEVGIHDNFFELGGDSIISIQIIARANQQGVRLTPKQLFQNQTIAQLAAVAKTVDAPVEAEQDLVTGALPLTPVQHWFFEQDISEPHHWNQSLLFDVKQRLDAAVLEKTVGLLLAHHDALRLRFTKKARGWQQFNAAPTARVPFDRVDLSALTAAGQSSEIERRAAAAQGGFDLSEGPLLRIVLFDCGADGRSRLLLVVHHLAIDGISWRVLLEDFQSIYGQLERGESVQLPRKSTSFKRWANQLAENAQSPETRNELPFWLKQHETPVACLPRDKEDGENSVASAETLVTELSIKETRALLQDVPAAFHTQINDALLAALAEAFARWTGAPALLIELEGHGREEINDELDLSLTVGWFTTHFPVVLNIQGATNPGEALKTVKEHLRQIPRRGIGYGLLRYLCADSEVAAQLCAAPQPEVSFNYLGQLDQTLSESALLTIAGENAGAVRSPSAKRPFLLEVGGSVAGGRLLLNWTYSRHLHHRATIETLAEYFVEALRSLIAHSATSAGGFTPSDFPLARLDQSKLDELTQDAPLVEDIYPLSPVQQGLLFHSLYAPEAGLYFEQKTCLLRGKLHSEAFQHACQQVVNRHTILRTAFMWQGLEEPLQVVRGNVEVPWIELDWITLSTYEQQQRLEDFFKDDRAKPFDPAVAPLMRMALIRVDADTHRFIWSHHHLLLDGWTMPILFREVFVLYEAFRHGRMPRLPVPRPYRNYIQWLARQDMSEAEAYWREALRDLAAPTSLSQKPNAEQSTRQGDIYDKKELGLSENTSRAARAFVRQHQLTINTLVQGMWALLLSHHSGTTDVVFGATVSGRPPSLEGVEHMVGLFINTLPVRARIRTEEPLLAWLKELQARQVEARQYEYTPLVKMQEWSDVPRELPLFENILVFDNYPIDNSLIPIDATAPSVAHEMFTIEDFEAFEKTNYAILVQAGMGEQLGFRMLYDRRLFGPEIIKRLLRHFELLLEGVIAQPEATLKTILDLMSDFDRQQEAAAQQTRSAAKFKKFGQVQPKAITVAAANEA